MSDSRLRFFNRKIAIEAVAAAVVSAFVTSTLYLCFEARRDQRQRTHDYILLFHSDAHAAYRDVLTETWMRPDVFPKIGAAEQDYAKAILKAANEDPRIFVAAFAMVDFLANVRSCIQTKSCLDGSQAETFRTFAYGFHQNFFPILRSFDCINADQSTEKLVLTFASSLPETTYDCANYIVDSWMPPETSAYR